MASEESVNVEPVKSYDTRCPAVPAKVHRPRCPGMVVVSVDAGPPTVICAVTSGGTMLSWAEIEPVWTPAGSATTW